MSNLLKTELYKLFHSWYFWGIGIFNLLLSSILLLDSKERSSNLIMASLYNIPLQGMLSIAFDRAIVLGIAKKNPSRMIGNIKSKKTKVDFWTLEEFQKVISLLCKKDYYEHYS